MSRFEATKLEKVKRTLNMAIAGPSGSGKSKSALMLANHLGRKKIVVIEVSERGIEEYENVCSSEVTIVRFAPPHGPLDYIDAINHVLKEYDPDLIIIDTITPEWKGQGGCLEMVSAFKNSTMGWKKVTPLHDAFMNHLKMCPVDLICLIRAKESLAYLKEEGETESKKHFFGFEPEQRGNVEFEFRLFLDLNQQHKYVAYNKRSTNLSDELPLPFDEKAFGEIKRWLETGVDKEDSTLRVEAAQPNIEAVLDKVVDDIKKAKEEPQEEEAEWKAEANELLDAIDAATEWSKVLDLANLVEKFISETPELPKEAAKMLRDNMSEKTVELESQH